jgi:uncharacterized cupin superfamily protein
MTDEPGPNVVNIAEIEEIKDDAGSRWVSYSKPLTPALTPRSGRLGVNQCRLPPGMTSCPFHTHQLEDEVFIVTAGRGVFRYGDTVREIGPGDCIACPAGAGVAHQIANPFADEDLVYLAIGMNDPNEVCTYPDNGKIMVRSLHQHGHLKPADYFEGEPDPPVIFSMKVGDGSPD